ncbi:hypothetical protein [Prochlorococcus sp. MIT 1341]|uniref:hypothetical protein n=1 Tax=Prochlorococcus sp. MIT 1341 TaxID=3096221 RepID=UPI002A765989|nr:hypothetical protein [Prochlorococcus sp. MIT 1341]
MASPTSSELKESIKELSEYRQRLAEEITGIAKKLKMPPKKIDKIVKDHPELTQISRVILQLKAQLNALEI